VVLSLVEAEASNATARPVAALGVASTATGAGAGEIARPLYWPVAAGVHASCIAVSEAAPLAKAANPVTEEPM
jgi:hypothetical protein